MNNHERSSAGGTGEPMGRVDMPAPLAEKLLAEDEGRFEEVGEEDVDASAPARSGRFGGKGFGLLASIALTTNNISGAGMLEFPQMFQRAGLLPSLLSLGLVSRQAYPIQPQRPSRETASAHAPRVCPVCRTGVRHIDPLRDDFGRHGRAHPAERRLPPACRVFGYLRALHRTAHSDAHSGRRLPEPAVAELGGHRRVRTNVRLVRRRLLARCYRRAPPLACARRVGALGRCVAVPLEHERW